MIRFLPHAVCFDMDGVLIQSRPVIEQAWQAAAHDYGMTLSRAQLCEHVHGRPGRHSLAVLFGTFSARERQRIQQKVDAFEEQAACDLVPGVERVLHGLCAAGVPVALVTSSWPGRIRHVLDQHALAPLFCVTVSREDVSRGKPDPACYRLAARQLETTPDRCLVFEDSPSGVRAAVASGTSCIGIGDDSDLLALGALAIQPDFDVPLPVLSALMIPPSLRRTR